MNYWIIESLIRMGNIVRISAESGIGSTFFCIALGLGISVEGLVFNRFRCLHPSSVIYYEGAMPSQVLKDRVRLMDSGDNMLELVSFDEIYGDSGTFPSFKDMKFTDDAENKWNEEKYGVVIYDNTQSLFSQSETDSKMSEAEITKMMIRARQQNITQILIEPIVKNKFAIDESIVDLHLFLEPEHINDNLALRVSVLKARYLPADNKKMFTLELQTDENGRMGFEYIENSDELRLKALKEAVAGRTQQEISESIGVNQSTISRWIKVYISQGIIERRGRKISLTKKGIAFWQEQTIYEESD